MEILEDKELRREIILDNYQNPMNRGLINDTHYIKENTNNESCIDNIDLYITLKDNVIKNITFDGEACAISTSSTSIMINNLIGKTIDEALEYINDFECMINEQKYHQDNLKEALVYDEIYKQKSRKTCAILPYKGIKKVLLDYKGQK